MYPVQIQADNIEANESMAIVMCHVFDIRGEIMVFEALTSKYLHVIAWDNHGNKIREYDNR